MNTRIFFRAGAILGSLLAPAAIAANWTVTNTVDDPPPAVPTPGSLRWAIHQANADNAPPVVIDFAVPDGLLTPPGPGGVAVIQPKRPLPIIQNLHGHGIKIDGFTQPGSGVVAGNPSSLLVKVELDGSLLPPSGMAPPFQHGLHIMSSGNTVQGLCVHGFPNDGICIQGIPPNTAGHPGSNANTIQWNLVGTDVKGLLAMPNGHDGAWPGGGGLWGGIYVKVLPGMPGIADQNWILENIASGNAVEGIGIANCPDEGSQVTRNHVERNYVGIDISGVAPLGNGHTGVYIGEGARDNVVEQNWIGANRFEGVSIVGLLEPEIYTDGNDVMRNRIGLDVAMNPMPNGLHGVAIGSYGHPSLSHSYIGGHARKNVVRDNDIAYNSMTGVAVQEGFGQPDNASGNTITRNRIHHNGYIDPGYLGIDLAFEPGVTPNDPGDSDAGPNALLNFPVIQSAVFNGTATTVSGTIDVPLLPVTIEFFRAVPDPTGSNHGQGAVYLGNVVAGSPAWSTPLPAALPGQWITATATDPLGNTSEFSLNVPVIEEQQAEFDFGDAPDRPYPTLLANGGAHHRIVPGMYLGASVDGEFDGQPDATATGDDLDGNDDEDGVTLPTAMVSGVPTTIQVTTSGAGFVQVWIDWNADGDWMDVAEQVVTDFFAPGPGTHAITFPVPRMAGASTYARVRFSSVQGLGFAGPAPDGEVEDYVIDFESLKWLQIPEQGAEGVDVSNVDFALGDDFLCTESGPVTDIHLWGSFHGDVLPPEGPAALAFDLQIWSDVPAGVDSEHSHPGELLWEARYDPGSYEAGPIWNVKEGEWWHDPATGLWEPGADRTIYQFDFYPDDPFIQQEGRTYWLVVRYAYEGPAEFRFGWKTTPDGWNDDAVVFDPEHQPVPWRELYYEPPHPWAPNSLNLAFALSGEPGETLDWGDAPDSPYPTLAASGGPSHIIRPGIHLGAGVDAEPDGQPDATATGDDLANTDDEDGVVFGGPLFIGQAVNCQVTASVAGFLDAWIDFDGNGVFGNLASELVYSGPLTAGLNTIPVNVPANAVPGPTFSRFRFNTFAPGLPPQGPASDGEVEDHMLMIDDPNAGTLGDWVWDDLNQNGIQDAGEPGLDGVQVDLLDGSGNLLVSTTTAGGGYYQFGGLAPGTYQLQFYLPPGYVVSPQDQGSDDTIDSDANPATGLTALINVAAGVTDLTWDAGMFRQQEPEEFDFGDAPDSAATPLYPTLLTNNGARHQIVIGGPVLGSVIDAEPDGQPDPAALGDDNNLFFPGGPDDEDGVMFPTSLIVPVPAVIQVTSATGGILQGWIDWNGDGDWLDTGEQVITNLAIPAGTTSVPITVPWGATGGANGLTYARFRISSQQGLGFAGPAPDGEVEDYLVRLEELKWLQIPEQGQEGVDVSNADHTLADDFLCTASGPVTDIHFWGSFLGDNLPEEGPGGLIFDISIWSDVPAGVNSPYSHPGQKLWQMTFTPGQYAAGRILTVDPGEWWHDPGTQNWKPNADRNIYQFDFYPPKEEAFVQEEGTIYWLAVKYSYTGPSQWSGKFGWKTTPQPWNDDACYQDPSSQVGWSDMIYQFPHPWANAEDPLYRSVNLAFALSGEAPEVDADWGDAPDPAYPTLKSSNGAHHAIVQGYHMGAAIDAEPDGQPSALADGDDMNPPGGPDDEDGVYFYPLIIGQQGAIDVSVSGNGFIDAWIDFNGNGSWLDAGDQISTSVPVTAGLNQITFNPPAGAVTGPTYVRVRFSSTGGLPPTGSAPDGEVEDYRVDILPEGELVYDLGDAPLPYPTLAATGGARHIIVPGYHMGATIDAEPDGQPSVMADGDDLNPPGSPDDEDGVFLYPLIIGQQGALDVSVSGSGFIDAWIDFNRDSAWSHPAEQIAASVAVTAGRNQIVFNVPAGAVTGPTYVRVRFSSMGGLLPTGSAPDGEVEDYRVDILPEGELVYDFGDAPDPMYPTLAASNGARHLIGGPLWLGQVVDAEPDGQPDPAALGDDNNLLFPGGPDDEDGVTFGYALIGGRPTVVEIIASAPGSVDMWIDWSGNASWLDPGDRVLLAHPVVPGPNYVTLPVPPTGLTGPTMARVRISTTGGLPPTGFAPDGEVEDHEVFVFEEGEMDFGDAPNGSVLPPGGYPTTMMDLGAAHFIDSLFMGFFIDGEIDGQPDPNAMGDDLSGGPDDEDGVTFDTAWVAGTTAQITVTLPPAAPAADLEAWVDWEGDGSWAQPGNHVVVNVPMVSGPNVLTIPVPTGSGPAKTFARFRLFHAGTSVGYGGFVQGGEVEDYQVSVGKVIVAKISVDNSVDPSQVVLNWTAEPGAASYSIYSSTSLGGTFPGSWTLESSGLNTLTWSENLSGTRKFYVVVAFP